MEFQVEFTSRAIKDLKNNSPDIQKIILHEAKKLESSPFPHKKTIKRIKPMNFPCFRLRIDYKENSFRLFYGIEKNIVFVLLSMSQFVAVLK